MLLRLLRSGIVLSIALTGALAAQDGCRGQTRIDLGYRQDDFSWSIAGPCGFPNVLSELEWKKLHLLEATMFGWHSDCYIPYLRWSAGFSAVMRGKAVDVDFATNDRHLEFSRAKASANRGNVVDLSAGLGWPFFTSWCGWPQLTPVVGISWHQQHLYLCRGRQLIALYSPAELGRIHGLRSEYRTHWWGPWVALDAFWECGARYALTGSFEYHWNARYSARGDWNLRKDFCGGFTHRAMGHGWIARLGGEFAFTCYWLFSLDLTVQNWRTKRGSDRTRVNVLVYDIDDRPVGYECCTLNTPFNGAKWESFSLALGLAYRY